MNKVEQTNVEKVQEVLNDILGNSELPRRAQQAVSGSSVLEEAVEDESDEESEGRRILHGAKNDTPPSDCSLEDSARIAELLDELCAGFEADDATNREKLEIARRYGPHLLELKEHIRHGKFMEAIKARYPKVNYHKCRRWMFIARHEDEVAQAVEKYPDIAWGPKKMIDFINGVWTPEPEDEGDMGDDDEEEWCGNVSDESGNEEVATVSFPSELTPTVKPGAAVRTSIKKAKTKNSTRPSVTVKHKSESPASEPEDSEDDDDADSADELDEYGEVYSTLDDALMKLEDVLRGDWPDGIHELDAIHLKVQECEQKLAEITVKTKELLNDVNDDEPEEILDDDQDDFSDDDN